MSEYAIGNIFVREGFLNMAGDAIETHKHNFDHVTYIAKGSARIEQMDEAGNVLQTVEKKSIDGKNWVLVLKDKLHRITALEDGTVYHCVYAHRTPQGEVVQEYDGWRPATT